MIDRIKTSFSRAGLTFPFKRMAVEEVVFLPEPAAVVNAKLYVVGGVNPELQYASAVEAIGLDVYRKMDVRKCKRWQYALFQTNLSSVRLVQEALKTAVSFREAVESLESPVVRLVAIHLFNGLIKNGTSFTDSINVDFAEWGGTADFVAGKKRASLLPLLGAYAPSRLYGYFPAGILSLVVDGLEGITHTEVRSTYAEILREIFNS